MKQTTMIGLLDQALADLQPESPLDYANHVVRIDVGVGRLKLVYENKHGQHETPWYAFTEGPGGALAQADGDPGV